MEYDKKKLCENIEVSIRNMGKKSMLGRQSWREVFTRN